MGNVLVKDAVGEVTRIFKVSVNIHEELEKIGAVNYEEEQEIDISAESVLINKSDKKASKKKKKKKEAPKESEKSPENEIQDIEGVNVDFNKDEASKETAKQLGQAIKEAKEKAEQFIEDAKDAKLYQKGDKYVVKVNKQIVGVYGDIECAKAKIERMKHCTIDKLGLRLAYHVRFMLDEFANSVTRSTVKTVGITDKAVA